MADFPQVRQREHHLDFVAGIMILVMVYGHCGQFADAYDTPAYEVVHTVFACFMAWFYFKAGMFHNPNRTVVETFRSCLHRLFVPFIVFTIAGHLLYTVPSQIIDGTLTIRALLLDPVVGIVRTGAAGGNLALWFLLSLFLVKVMFAVLCRHTSRGVRLVATISGGGDFLPLSTIRPGKDAFSADEHLGRTILLRTWI